MGRQFRKYEIVCFSLPLRRKQEMEEYKVLPVGDQAMVIEFGSSIDDIINQKVVKLSSILRNQRIPGIVDIMSTYRSVMIFYDKTKTNFYRLSKIVKKYSSKEQKEINIETRTLLIPCCYEDEYSKDLDDMESALDLSRSEIVNIHSERAYKVYMLGFLPGFVYLGGLDRRIHMPRLKTPRLKIPERSVGIGGNQTGVYPMESPGGWRLIGKTPVDFYNPRKEKPILCQAGDIIKFFSVTSSEYRAIRNDVINERYEVEIV